MNEATMAEFKACKKSGSKSPPPDLRRSDLGKSNSFNLERQLSGILQANKDYGKSSKEGLDDGNAK